MRSAASDAPAVGDPAGGPRLPAAPAARILERGYRRYEGPRRGPSGAARSIVRHTVQRCLGLHRPARAKVFPVLTVVLAYVPTIIYVGITVLGNRLEDQGAPGRAMVRQFIPTYASNYLQVVLAIVLFAAFVAPEVLCPDRRTGMLGLYLAAPLTRWRYLAAKATAVLAMVSIVTVGPPVILLIGYSTQGFGPQGVADWAATIGRILGAGLAVSVLYTTVSLAISSITSRKAAASAAFLAAIVGLPALLTYLVVAGGQSSMWRLGDLFTLPYEAVFRIFAEPSPFLIAGEPELPATSVWAAYVLWMVVSLGVIVVSYRRVEVTR